MKFAVYFVLFVGACFASAAGNRIIGGELTTIEQYPSIVAIESLGVFTGTWGQSCGGNILTTRWVVSAAHCFEGLLYAPERRRVRAGSSFRNTGGQLTPIVTDHKHPSYGQLGPEGDITVVLLQNALIYNPAVAFSSIVSQDFELPDGSAVIYAGWGTTSEGGQRSEQLQHVTINTINRELCRQRYHDLPPVGSRPVTANMICAGILDVGGKDACQGDSGGPLFFRDATNTLILVGIVSWGHGCGNETYPGVNARVSSYTNWIIDTATGNN